MAAEKSIVLNDLTKKRSRIALPTHCRFCPPPESSTECHFYRSFDHVLDAVGSFGRYQVFICALIVFANTMWIGNFYLLSFAAAIPEKWICLDPDFLEFVETSKSYYNITHCDPINYCSSKANITYTKHSQFHGIVHEWKLDCGYAYQLHYISLAGSLGAVVGSLVGGHCGDYFGRKRFLYIGQFAICIIGVLTTASTRWEAMCVCRSLTDFVFGLSVTNAFVLLLEIMDSRHRMIASVCFQNQITSLLNILIAWVTNEWRLYVIMFNFITSFSLIGFLLVRDSPRWLIQKQRSILAAETLTDIGSEIWNRKKRTILAEELISIPIATQRIYTMVDLFRRKSLTRATIAHISVTIAGSIVIMASSVTSPRYVSNSLANLAIESAILLSIPMGLVVLDWKIVQLGRKTIILYSLTAMLICSMIVIIVLAVHGGSMDGEYMHVAAIFGFIGNAIYLTAGVLGTMLHAAEFLPTVVRATGVGLLWAVDFGFLVIIEQIMHSVNSEPLWMYSLSIVTSAVALILSYKFLVETKNRPLKDSIEQYD